MKARDVMTTELVVVRPDTPLKDVAEMIVQRQIGGVPVVNPDESLVGIVNEADLVPKQERVPYTNKTLPALFSDFVNPSDDPLEQYRHIEKYTAADVMRTDIPAVQADDDVAYVTELMTDEVRRLPVLQDGKLVGIITRKDLIRAATRTKLT
jgi:CBS domain-containing protein